MTAPSFTYSGNVYSGASAGTVDFALTSTTGNAIAYLESSHIHVYKSTDQGVTWAELARPSQWDFVTNGTVARLTSGIAAGEWIKVQRITPSTSSYVTFQASSLLTAEQLNDDTLFNTYLNQERVDQSDQSTLTANAASTAATTATTTANTALSTANAAQSSATSATATANTALSNSTAAVSTANTALSTANTASTNASAAVSTANTASTNATTALTTANTAATNASSAVTTANAASTSANAAVSTANSAASNASTALSTANTALSTANSAASTATAASTAASNAVTTANTADANASAALNAVASSVQYTLVANVAAIPASPNDGDAIEVADSTGLQNFTPLANIPAGYVGDSGLSARIQYSSSGSTWNWLNYFPNNAESRYLKLSGGTVTGAITLPADPTQNLQAATKQYVDNAASSGGLPLTGGTMTGQILGDNSTSPATPGYAFDGDANTGLYTTGADELALSTGGVARVTIDSAGAVSVTNSLSVGGQAAVVTNDARLTDARTPTDGSVTDAKVAANAAIAGSKIQAASTSNAGAVQLTDSTSSTSTTTAATPNSVKTAYDLANAALPSSGGALTGDVTLNAQSDLRFADADSSNWVAFQGPATVSSNVTWTLPSADGTSGQVLSTNGSGTLSWATAAAGGASVTTSDTAPSSPSDGDLWYDSVGGRTYVYYDDGDTSQWVDAAPQGGGGSATSITTGNTTAEVIDTGSDGRFVVTTEGTERARVDSSGRLLVGTTNATDNARLGVKVGVVGTSSYPGISITGYLGTGGSFPIFDLANSRGTTDGSYTKVESGDCLGRIHFRGSDGTQWGTCASIDAFVDGATGSGDLPGRLCFNVAADGTSSPTQRMRIYSDGGTRTFTSGTTGIRCNSSAAAGTTAGLFLGTHSASSVENGTASFVVWTNGNVVNTNNSYGSLSDIKLKENIVDASSQWSDIKALQVRNYNFKEGQTHTQIGLVAQEAELVSPGLVYESPDRDEEGNDLGTVTKSVNYSVLYMKAVKALQEAMERIETLEAQNASQAATIASLEARLTALEGGN